MLIGKAKMNIDINNQTSIANGSQLVASGSKP